MIFAHAGSRQNFTHSQPKVKQLFLMMQIWLSLLIDTFSLRGSHFLTDFATNLRLVSI